MIFRTPLTIITSNTKACYDHVFAYVDRPNIDRVSGDVPIGAAFDGIGPDEVVMAAVEV